MSDSLQEVEIDYEQRCVEREKESAAARAQFVAMIKDENYYLDYGKWSLRQHWSGARGGFADEQLQKRWRDFEAGWKAAKGFQ